MTTWHTIPESDPVTAAKPPLVVTLAIALQAAKYFNALRKAHFPPERNYLDAHVTLFNALPHETWIVERIGAIAAGQPAFEVTAEAVMSLGNGTAFRIAAPELRGLHQQLQQEFTAVLTNQDRQKRNFHITIQNKVDAASASALQNSLTPEFAPFAFRAEGIQVWRYLGGPWEPLMTFGFRDMAATN